MQLIGEKFLPKYIKNWVTRSSRCATCKIPKVFPAVAFGYRVIFLAWPTLQKRPASTAAVVRCVVRAGHGNVEEETG